MQNVKEITFPVFFKEKKPNGTFQKSILSSSELSQKNTHKNSFLNEKKSGLSGTPLAGPGREESVFFNYPFDKGRLKTIVCWFFEKHGQYKTLKFLEKLKEVGFGSATNAGISLGIDDLKIPNQKIPLVSKAETKVLKDFLYYRNAQITGIERIQRFIYTWNQTNDTLKQEVVRLFETTDLLNPIYMMAFSGARGNMSQVRQLVGMRGLMSDPQGQIIDFPIMSNFREGLTLTEYLISTYGARKGIVDTALRTATAGYLTRRLVDVAQHTIVSKFDCGTMRGIFLFDMKDGKKTIYSFQNRLIGRVLAQNIEFSSSIGSNEKNGIHFEKKQRAFRNQEIDSKLAQVLSKVTKKAFVRSPLTCETSRFVCQLCYGWSFSHGKLVSVGEAVGIIAAQSIGEPGTQLTMRTFHTGGVFAGGLTDQILAPFDGKIKYLKNIPGTCVRNALSEMAFFTKMPGSFLIEKETDFLLEKKTFETKKGGPSGTPLAGPGGEKKSGEIFRIPAYAVLFCRNNEFVKKKQVLAQFSSVFKKMQYGQAEQTLYSTSSGEFVFGKSLIFDDSEGSTGQNKKNECFQNLNTIGKQTLLLEKRKSGDFSEVELRNDILWKSQNWTTVWILSGNLFSLRKGIYNKNFLFKEGDFFKKTSVLQRVLWKKKKKYKYFLFEKKKKAKFQKNVQYLFAVEKKFINFSHFSFNSVPAFFEDPEKKQRKIVSKNFKENGEKHFFMKKNVQTHFLLFSFGPFERNLFFKTKKNFLFCTSLFSPGEKNTISSKTAFSMKKSSSFSLQSKKNESDFSFLRFADQNKFNHFFSHFEKRFQQSHFQKEKKEIKKQKEIEKNLFFKFLQKQKNSGSPFFFNISLFSKIHENSQKFEIFSLFPLKKNKEDFLFSKNLFFMSQNPFSLQNSFQRKKEFQFSENSLPMTLFQKKRKPKKCISNRKKDTLFQRAENQKKSQRVSPLSTEKETKNIYFKKTFFKFPLSKMFYKNFGYVSSFYTFTKNQKMKNSFLTFSTFTEKQNFENEQKNIGKRENFFSSVQNGNENFFGKEVPNTLSSCFFSNFQTKNGGIFSISSFEQNSKKERIFSFLCENFSEFQENQNPSVITEFFFKNSISQVELDTKVLNIKMSVLFGQKFLYSTFLKNRNDNTKKLKKNVLSSIESLFLFQMPTFSFLSLYKDFFENSFSFFKEKKAETFHDTKNSFLFSKKQKNSFFFLSHFEKAKKLKEKSEINANKKSSLPGLCQGGNKYKVEFFDFCKQPFMFFRNRHGEIEKKKYFFYSHFSLDQSNDFKHNFLFFKNGEKNKKGKSDNFDLYEKEISWLPQENIVISTSEIMKENSGDQIPENFYSCSHQKPFLFFVNRQGKKKSFSWNGGTVFSKSEENGIEGFVKISYSETFLPNERSAFPSEKKSRVRSFFSEGKIGKEKNPLLQKLSFFSRSEKNKKTKKQDISNFQFSQERLSHFLEKYRKKKKRNFQKTIAFQFQKRKEKWKKNRKLFSQKSSLFSFFENQNKEKRKTSNLSRSKKNFFFSRKKETVSESFQKKIFFGKKFKTQCFTCLPFQKKKKVLFNSTKRSVSLHKYKQSLQRKKIRFTIEQGWPVLPFFFSSKKGLGFTEKKKIEKKGHFYSLQNERHILFEQNDTFLETVLFPINKELLMYQIDSLHTNKNCRFLSFDSFEFSEKKASFGFFSSKKENENQKFGNFETCSSPFQIKSQISNVSSVGSEAPFSREKKKNIVQLYRPFQYTILENSRNVEKFLFHSGIQFFSKMNLSSNFFPFSYEGKKVGSCFQIYKKYHSPLFNKQKKDFFLFLKNREMRKNPNFQICSNFEEMSSFQSISSFFSFSQQNVKLSFKKKFCTNFKFQEQKKENEFSFLSFLPSGGFSEKKTKMPTGKQGISGIGEKKFFFHFQQKKENTNFSYSPIQFLPLVLSLQMNDSQKREILLSQKRKAQKFENSFFQTCSMNAFQNTIEFDLCEKRATFFDERFSFGNFFDFFETSSFWLNKDSMNFLFPLFFQRQKEAGPLYETRKNVSISSSSKRGFQKNTKIYKNTVFENNIDYYGSTEFLSLYEGELLPLVTHEMDWWKKASEISTLQKFEKLFTIVSKKDFFSVSFSLSEQNEKNGSSLFQYNFSNSLKAKQKHLEPLSQILSKMYTKTHFFNSIDKKKSASFVSLNDKKKFDDSPFSPLQKTKISSFLTKYENKIYTFQNLTVGYSSVLKKPFLGSFVVYGDNFFGSAIQKPGQIIHLSFSSMTLRRGQPCFVSSNGIFHFYTSPYIEKNVPLVTLPYQTVQAGDIVQGIPKVEQLFEARTTLQGRLFVSSLPILLKGIFERYKVLLPLEQATRQSFLKIQQIIVDGVQRVYRSQGVSITDKHLEVVVRQMTTKVQILHGAQTGFFPGELVSLDFVERINQFLMVKIRYEPVILGITRASLEVESFLSASSFQQTTKILSLAAISRKKDFLKGLKENLLVGNVIPSGTGFFHLSKKM